MKKILSLILVLVLALSAFTLASCEVENKDSKKKEKTIATLNGMTPEELYNETLELLTEASNYTSVSTQDISMTVSAQGMTVDMVMKQSIETKVTGLMNQYVSVQSLTEMIYQGQTIPQQSDAYYIYIVDGMVYTNFDSANATSGSKIKYEISEDDIKQVLPSGSNADSPMAMLPPGFFEDTAFIENSDGTFTVKVTMSTEEYTEYFGGFNNGTAIGSADITIKKVVHKINFDVDGNLIDIVSDISMSMVVEGTAVDATAVSTTVFSDIGTTAPIEAPSDYHELVQVITPTPTPTPKLVVATSPDFPPFEYIEDGNVVGIEVEIMQIICDRLGYELVIEYSAFDSVIPGVQTNKYRCGMSAIPITPDREENVLFTTPYCLAVQCIVVKADSAIASKADLAGKTIAVQSGTTAEDFCLSEGYTVQSYEANPDAKIALTTGKVDAWVVDDLTAAEMCEGDETVKILDESMTEEPYAFAFNFDDELLVDKIDVIIEELIEDGTIAEIFAKYDIPYTRPLQN